MLNDNLLFRFSAISFILLATIAMCLAYVLANKVRSDAVTDLADQAIGAATGRLLSVITPSDFEEPMSGKRYYDFDRFVQQSIVSKRTSGVKLWSRDGTVMYSNDPQVVGERSPVSENLSRTLRGETPVEIVVPKDTGREREEGVGALMDVYAPVVFPGAIEPNGVLEIRQYYEPTARRIKELRRWIYGSIGVGFLTLYVSLVWSRPVKWCKSTSSC